MWGKRRRGQELPRGVLIGIVDGRERGAGVSGGLPAAASSDDDAPAAVAVELGVGELKWRSGKLVGRSDRVEDGRRGKVSLQGRRQQ